MKVRDKRLGKEVDVYCRECLGYKCYWAREDPGSFVQGRGYRHRSNDYLCGNREIHGCPDNPEKREE
jgi:hypothetical protein